MKLFRIILLFSSLSICSIAQTYNTFSIPEDTLLEDTNIYKIDIHYRPIDSATFLKKDSGKLFIKFGDGFKDDNVKLFINDSLFMEEKITSSNGFAKIVVVKSSMNVNNIGIILRNGKKAVIDFKSKFSRIEVNYYRKSIFKTPQDILDISFPKKFNIFE